MGLDLGLTNHAKCGMEKNIFQTKMNNIKFYYGGEKIRRNDDDGEGG